MDSKKPKSDVYWVAFEISKADRRKLKGHASVVIWLTGLPASGKTSIARELEKRLHEMGAHTYVLDGDNMRHGLNRDLGFSKEDRQENIRRIAEVAKLFVDAGIITICAFVSPFKEDRETARSLVEANEFIEVFVNCPVSVCIERDPKSLYKKALSGQIKSFTGVNDPYEVPDCPDIVVETNRLTLSETVDTIVKHLNDKGLIEELKCNACSDNSD
ncbi:MAG: adenylyl-sulfate kinase [Nitrospirae bacterium]|nr:adenylyl-sulfate kinase [Nitrospirota bacterium]